MDEDMDIVVLLRMRPNNQWMLAAADEIERLRAEIERLSAERMRWRSISW